MVERVAEGFTERSLDGRELDGIELGRGGFGVWRWLSWRCVRGVGGEFLERFVRGWEFRELGGVL